MLKAISKKPKLPLKPKETKIREANFYEMKEREYLLFGKGFIM